jgi:hypothetical protein
MQEKKVGQGEAPTTIQGNSLLHCSGWGFWVFAIPFYNVLVPYAGRVHAARMAPLFQGLKGAWRTWKTMTITRESFFIK